MGHRGSPRYFCKINSKIEKNGLGQRMETSIQGTESLKVLTSDSKSVASETSGSPGGRPAVTLRFLLPSPCSHSRAGSTSYLCFQTSRKPSPPHCKQSPPLVLLESWKMVSMRPHSSLVPRRGLLPITAEQSALLLA